MRPLHTAHFAQAVLRRVMNELEQEDLFVETYGYDWEDMSEADRSDYKDAFEYAADGFFTSFWPHYRSQHLEEPTIPTNAAAPEGHGDGYGPGEAPESAER